MHAVDSKVQRQLVKIGVDGFLERLVDVHRAVAATLPVAVGARDVGQVERAARKHLVAVADHAELQPRQAKEGL